MILILFGLLALIGILGYMVLVYTWHIIKLEEWAYKTHQQTHKDLNELMKLK